MRNQKFIMLVAVLAIGVALSAFMPKSQEYRAKNLKVLPKDISKEEIENIMEDFKIALGVKCGFCHASRTDDPSKLDFASDDKFEKEIARKMMKMTAQINKDHFQWVADDGMMRNITCMTCHNGEESPKTIAITPKN